MAIGALDGAIESIKAANAADVALKQRLMKVQLLLEGLPIRGGVAAADVVALTLAGECVSTFQGQKGVDEFKLHGPVTDEMIQKIEENTGVDKSVLTERFAGRSPFNIITIAALTRDNADNLDAYEYITQKEKKTIPIPDEASFAKMVEGEKKLKNAGVAVPASLEALYKERERRENAKQVSEERDDYPESRSPSPRASSAEPSPLEEKARLKAQILTFEKAAAVQSPAASSTPRLTKATLKGEQL